MAPQTGGGAMPDLSLQLPLPGKPRLRGRLHQVAFVVSIPAGIALVWAAHSPLARVAALVYAISLAAMRRRHWSPRAWLRMDQLDRVMIYVLIAGSYTPVVLLALRPGWRVAFLALVWTVAAVGICLVLVWNRGRVIFVTRMVLYLGLGWISVVLLPQLADTIGLGRLALGVLGGVLYTVGVVVLIRRRPDPNPRVFGYHEVWHAFTVAAGACHYALIWLLATSP
jgi:hemolysin III